MTAKASESLDEVWWKRAALGISCGPRHWSLIAGLEEYGCGLTVLDGFPV